MNRSIWWCVCAALAVWVWCGATIAAQPEAGVSAGTHAGTDGQVFRGLWITRWDYRTEADVKRAISDAASLGVTDVMWQVRGQADAYYKSDLEPWGEELFRQAKDDERGAGGTRTIEREGSATLADGPGFDPLEAAVREAHARGLRLHAWVNVMPLWKGTTPPRAMNHPYHTRPEWRLRDAEGTAQALNDHYVIVNPLLPAVQEHITAVCRDIVQRYAVDGIHMDYVRFVSDTMKDPARYPGDAESLRLLAAHLGREVKVDAQGRIASDADKAAFRDLKRSAITSIVRKIKEEAVGSRKGVVLTAAVWRRPEMARDTYLQDAAAWLRDGLIDRAMPMIYTAKMEQFESDVAAWLAAAGGAGEAGGASGGASGEAGGKSITPGIANYLHAPEETTEQITHSVRTGTSGSAVFAYSSLFESVSPDQDKKAAEVEKRAARRAALAAYFEAGIDRRSSIKGR